MIAARRLTLPAILALLTLLVTSAVAQPQGDRRERPAEGGNAGALAFLLLNERVRKDIELVDHQEARLQKIGEEFGKEMRRLSSGMRGLSPDERQARLAEMQAARERLDETVADVLLPHQWDRLHQIQIHQLMRRQGTGGALANEALAETLGITPEQQQRLRAKQEKVAKDVQKRIAEIHREARDEVLSVLTPTQRKKLEEMLGEPFDTQVER